MEGVHHAVETRMRLILDSRCYGRPQPSFWLEFGQRLVRALLPLAWRYVSTRMPPEEEAAWHQAERRGQGEEWVKKSWRSCFDW